MAKVCPKWEKQSEIKYLIINIDICFLYIYIYMYYFPKDLHVEEKAPQTHDKKTLQVSHSLTTAHWRPYMLTHKFSSASHLSVQPQEVSQRWFVRWPKQPMSPQNGLHEVCVLGDAWKLQRPWMTEKKQGTTMCWHIDLHRGTLWGFEAWSHERVCYSIGRQSSDGVVFSWTYPNITIII